MNNKLCPSARCEEGAVLVGVVLPTGEIGFLEEKIVIDHEFVQVAHEGRAPEKRFRFANSCAQCACAYWAKDSSRCSLIEGLLREATLAPNSPELLRCSIRGSCRWFNQVGLAACHVCSFIVTNTDEGLEPAEEVPRS